MKPMTVGVAMLLLVFGNQIAILSDALIKSVGNDVAVFQFVFFRQLSAVLILLPFFLFSKPKNITEGLKWHALRAHVWLFGAIFMVYAISSMPLATANAIFYAAPLMMLPLAGLFFGEKLSRQTIAAAIMGFAGVLVIIRPDQVDFAALSALVVALTIAVNNLLIRKLPKQQSVVHTLLITNLVGMPVSLCLAYMEGQSWDWSSFPVAAASSTFILIYAATCVLTYRSVDSNKIASAEYSGLIGAVAVGLLWFGEVPDIFMAIGTLMIVVPIVWLTKHEKKRKRMHKETAIVESYLEEISPAVASIAKASQRIREGERGTIRLALYSSLAVKWLIPRLSDFKRLYPEIELTLNMVAEDPELSDNIGDCFITVEKPRRNFVAEPLYNEVLYPVCSHKIWKEIDGKNLPEALWNYPILSTDSVFRERGKDWLKWCQAGGITMPKDLDMQHFSHMLLAVEAAKYDQGITFANGYMMTERDLQDLVVIPSHGLETGDNFYFVYKKSRARQPEIKKLASWLQQQCS